MRNAQNQLHSLHLHKCFFSVLNILMSLPWTNALCLGRERKVVLNHNLKFCFLGATQLKDVQKRNSIEKR